MSADQIITPEKLAEWQRWAKNPECWGVGWEDLQALLDALTASRAEVQRLTEEAREYRALVATVDDAKDAEIAKLRDEARRSDAGRVEVPERRWTGGYPDLAAPRPRLSPSPQPATGTDPDLLEALEACFHRLTAMGAASTADKARAAIAKAKARDEARIPTPQPSADVVWATGLELAAIGRKHFGNPIPQAWYAASHELIDAINSSTNHDSKEP